MRGGSAEVSDCNDNPRQPRSPMSAMRQSVERAIARPASPDGNAIQKCVQNTLSLLGGRPGELASDLKRSTFRAGETLASRHHAQIHQASSKNATTTSDHVASCNMFTQKNYSASSN